MSSHKYTRTSHSVVCAIDDNVVNIFKSNQSHHLEIEKMLSGTKSNATILYTVAVSDAVESCFTYSFCIFISEKKKINFYTPKR